MFIFILIFILTVIINIVNLIYQLYFLGIIADMSLDIRHKVGSFKIKHLPEEVVKVRIGNHTGSCCAGKQNYNIKSCIINLNINNNVSKYLSVP